MLKPRRVSIDSYPENMALLATDLQEFLK